MKRHPRVSHVLWGALVAGLVSSGAVLATPQSADTVLLHGHIHSGGPTDRVVSALAIRGGRILELGSDESIGHWVGPRTRVIDLAGRTATPGLIDTHAHLAPGGLAAVRDIPLDDISTIAEAVARVEARAKTAPPGAWILGRGWDEGKLREGRYIEARDLDPVSGDHPVWLEHTTGHYGVANHRALALVGIGDATPDPKAGTIDRDAQGRPTGVLKESAQELVGDKIPDASLAERREGIRHSLQVMAEEGMTGAKDPSVGDADWEAYTSLAAEGALTARICVLYPGGRSLAETNAALQVVAHWPRPSADRDLSVCGFKLFMDGSGGARTAWMYDDWNRRRTDVDAGNHGYPNIDPTAYRAMVEAIHRAGWSIGTHAIGDRAIDWVVDSYAQVLAKYPKKHLRHSIIHANVPSDHALETMARLQSQWDAAYPEAQGPFTWWIGDNYAGNFGESRSQRLNPFHTYETRGIRWAGGSDFDVTPLPARFGLWSSVERRTLNGTYGSQPFGTDQSVTIQTALHSYTDWAAPQLFAERVTGRLEAGFSADIAVWAQDPYAIKPEAIKDLHCVLTVYRGRIVFEAAH